MCTFVDRAAELTALRERLARPSSLSLLFGQRRVGKTFLLQHLLDGEPDALYFLADESTAPSLLRRFQRVVAASGRGGSLWETVTPSDWSTALTLLVQSSLAEGRPLVLVLDELQYLLAADPAVPSVLQRLWDEHHARQRLHLILCGSALGTLARLGDAGQPLHGRFDLRLQLQPFSYRQAADFVPAWGLAERLRLFGVFGGLARHLAEVDPARSLPANAVRALLDPLGALHEAPLDILRTEHVSAHADANAALAAIATGENQFGVIAAGTGLTGARLDYVLKELLRLEVIRREVRFGDRPGSRYTRYRCNDPLTVFWFRYVLPQRGALLGTPPARLWQDRIAPRLDEHMGTVFEEVGRQAIERGLLLELVGPVDEVAPYWSRDGRTEIDLVARSGSELLFVECKWRPAGEVGLPALRRLRGHVARYPMRGHSGAARLCLATAGRFSDGLRRVAEAEGVLLVGPEELLA